MTSYRQSMKDTLEDMYAVRETSLIERDLTPDEEKRREEIAKKLPDDEFKDRYGDKWMQVKMATATNMMKNEKIEIEIDERMKLPRQLIDKNKEVMIVKKNKVIVIDKKDQDKYMKQGWSLAEEVELDESVIDKVKEVASKKQAMKIDGVMVDSFTASAISQIYDKVNDANKKKMEKLPITKLADLAFKMMQKNEFVPEEVNLDEQFDFVLLDKDNKIVGRYSGKNAKKEAESSKKSAHLPPMRIPKNEVGKMKIVPINPKDKKGIGDMVLAIGEEVELDEGKMQDMWQKGAKSVKSGPFELMRGKNGVHAIMQNGKKLGDFSYDDEADNFVANMKGMKGQWVGNDIDSLINHLQKVHKEEVELDEKFVDKDPDGKKFGWVLFNTKTKELIAKHYDKKFIEKMKKRHEKMGEPVTMMTFSKAFKYSEEIDLEEASAAADARRAMRRDPDMKQKFSKDVSASDDDKKAASKNIMMQMRKVQSLRGNFNVEFQDGKKVKIPVKLAMAVQNKYNSLSKPTDKEKFQSKVGKSYRDMLNALKESAENPDYKAGGKSKADEYRNKAKQMVGAEAVSPAQQAAIAISKKERGEKPKKESILDRIDRKIKENKNG